ncbi:MAG: hypothetical protein R3A80_12495 [Bdellovibrionota bacterium]
MPNIEKSLPLINRFCQTDHTFPPEEVRAVDVEIFNSIVKNDPNDLYEIMSVRDINEAKDRDKIKPEAIAAYGILHGACLPFSIHLHQMTMADFPGGAYYITLMKKDTKSSCADGTKENEYNSKGEYVGKNDKFLCSEPLNALASRVEALAQQEAQNTSVYDNPALAIQELPLGQAYARKAKQYELERDRELEMIQRARDQRLVVLGAELEGIQKTRERKNNEYKRRLRENIEFRDRKIKEAQKEGQGI